jgi:F0F1-type ATP synthase alpha subunit
MKNIAGSLKLELAQFREVEAFVQFGSDLDAFTLQSIARGSRLVELLKQRQYEPLTLELQVALIFIGMRGLLDSFSISDINLFSDYCISFNSQSDPRYLQLLQIFDCVENKDYTNALESAAFVVESYKLLNNSN